MSAMKCPICKCELDGHNIALRDDGRVREDCSGRPWCIECTNEFDSIELDE